MPLANRFRLCLLHCVTKVSHTVDTARARQVASRPLPLSLGVPLVTRRNAANDTGDGYTQVYLFQTPTYFIMLRSKQQLLSKMVPNGTSTSRTCVRDASDTSTLKSNAAPLQSLDAASEKTYHCVTARGANYVVQAPNPSVAILKIAVLEERLESENVRKDDKDAYDLRREARKRNGSDARAELSACYSYIDGRKYGAERPHWLYTLDLKITEVEDNTAIAE